MGAIPGVVTQQLKEVCRFSMKFQYAFLLPRYWKIWIGCFFLGLSSLLFPRKVRGYLGRFVGYVIGKLAFKPRSRARVNLSLCFPDWSTKQREAVIDRMFRIAGQILLMLPDVVLRNPRYLQRHTVLTGMEHVEPLIARKKNLIFMLPHTWSIDTAGLLLSGLGLPMVNMYKTHSNPLLDWMFFHIRLRFGGRLYSRSEGMKPFLRAIKEGFYGYYLPDQDHGSEKSVFSPFFQTYKATLPALSRIAKTCNAVVVPLFAYYNEKKARVEVSIHEPMKLEECTDEAQVARAMNRVIEELIVNCPEQYLWVLTLLRTRLPGEPGPYA